MVVEIRPEYNDSELVDWAVGVLLGHPDTRRDLWSSGEGHDQACASCFTAGYRLLSSLGALVALLEDPFSQCRFCISVQPRSQFAFPFV